MQRKNIDERGPSNVDKREMLVADNANAGGRTVDCETRNDGEPRVVQTNDEVRIVHAPSESEPFLIIWKPHGVKSAPLYEGEADTAEDFASRLFPELKNVRGKKPCEHGLLHRLDTDACGLLLFAATQQMYDALSLAQAQGEFIKTYRVLCDFNKENARMLGGFPPLLDATSAHGLAENNIRGYAPGSAQDFAQNAARAHTAGDARNFATGDALVVSSFFRAYGKGRREVRPVVESSPPAARKKASPKRYTTRIEIIENANGGVLTKCAVSRGFRHQVRCHLAWLGLPARGDKLYNAAYVGDGAPCEVLQFECVALEFPNPLTGKTLRFINGGIH